MKAMDKVKKARSKDRISTKDIIQSLTREFLELHGDRNSEDDRAIIAGIGRTHENQPITIIGHEKGQSAKESVKRNFGSAGPGGYRKAVRLMEQAEKFNRPVLLLVNTAGANASPDSEDGGVGEAIARSLMTMSELTVPTLTIILGEGGSGGAIALAVSDQVWMLENSIYSILSPEGFSSILWKDSKRAGEAAEIMKLTASELLDLEIVDHIVPESKDKEEIPKDKQIERLSEEINGYFTKAEKLSKADRVRKKHERFQKF